MFIISTKQLGFSDEFAKEAASEAASEAFNMEYKTVSLLNGLQALTLFGRFKLGAFERGLAKILMWVSQD